MNKVYCLENEFFILELTSAGAVTLTVKRSQARFHTEQAFLFNYGGCYSFNLVKHAQMRVTQKEQKLAIMFSKLDWKARFPEHTYRKPDPGPDLHFSFSMELQGEDVLFECGKIRGMDEEECRLHFPNRLLSWNCEEEAQAIISLGYGMMIEYPRYKENFNADWGYFGAALYGFLGKKKDGFAVRELTPCDSTHHYYNSDNASLHSSFIYNKRFANYPRQLLWHCMPAGSTFFELAKWYRQCRMDEGTFVSLREKIEQHPDVEKLVGAVIWKHSVYSRKNMKKLPEKGYSLYAVTPDVALVEGKPDSWNAYELFDKAHAMGFDRLCVYNAGWNYGGYDSGYPTRFPVNSERGTEKEFRAAAEYARSLSPDYIYSVHDNYTDVYKNSLEDLAPSLRITRDGCPAKGFIWRGGRAYLQCTEKSLEYAKRDLPKIARMLGKGSIYVDVMGSSSLTECYSETHGASRRQDLINRRKFMTYTRKIMGSMASEAIPCDATVDLVDLGAYMGGALEAPFLPADAKKAVSIPLWQLIYHDSILGFTNAYSRRSAENYHALCALFGLLPGNLDEVSLQLSKELRSAYTAEMTRFKILSDKRENWFYVAESEFADGTVVIANTSDDDFVLEDGSVLPAHQFRIKHK